MHSLEQSGNPQAHQVNRLLQQKDRLIGAILLGVITSYSIHYTKLYECHMSPQ